MKKIIQSKSDEKFAKHLVAAFNHSSSDAHQEIAKIMFCPNHEYEPCDDEIINHSRGAVSVYSGITKCKHCGNTLWKNSKVTYPNGSITEMTSEQYDVIYSN